MDEDDGQIDRVIQVAGPEDITAFRNLFVNTSKKKLTDGHLWFVINQNKYNHKLCPQFDIKPLKSAHFLKV